MVSDPILTFIHISDTHLHRDPNFTGSFVDFSATPSVIALIREINQLPFPIDFVLHTGDIMSDPEQPHEYAIARWLMDQLKAPVRFLPGNHDRKEGVQTVLLNGTTDISAPDLRYEFEVNGVQIICLDSAVSGCAFGQIDDAQLAWLDALCSADDDRPLIVAVHHHVLPLEAPWLDTICLQNGDVVHATLLKARSRLRGVFYGHIHENTVTVRDGISYYSVRSCWFQTRTWHGQQQAYTDPIRTPGFNIVTLTERDLLVRFHLFAPLW